MPYGMKTTVNMSSLKFLQLVVKQQSAGGSEYCNIYIPLSMTLIVVNIQSCNRNHRLKRKNWRHVATKIALHVKKKSQLTTCDPSQVREITWSDLKKSLRNTTCLGNGGLKHLIIDKNLSVDRILFWKGTYIRNLHILLHRE